ncbi:MAG: endonuclease/exonuclease/phosphatase family protein [Phycisphaeraceae bacterium]|nr:MAG: endonuclease/exonuclease/phosphatase family protein [Phycisphaeraceae bacterium]
MSRVSFGRAVGGVGGAWMIVVWAAAAASVALDTPARAGGVIQPTPVAVRVATFNVEDLRTTDLLDPGNPKARRLAEVIQRLRPNIVLINEIDDDAPGRPGVPSDQTEPRLNARRFADTFLAVPQAEGLAPMRFKAYMAESNTGEASGFDLNRDGKVVTTYEDPPPREQTAAGRAYGEDCWGFGTYPGQYAMALLVDERLTIDAANARTFRLLPWDYMPGNLMPAVPGSAEPWYGGEVKERVRLTSKSHWDVPVVLPNGAVLRVLCSHPTPPAFDGPEERNKRRNHDEIRFWRDYLDNQPYLVDDEGLEGGLLMRRGGPIIGRAIPFVILGDLNADPAKGSSNRNPIRNQLFTSRHVNATVTPTGDAEIPGLAPSDTSSFKLRVDYVLPSRDIRVLKAGVWRHTPSGPGGFPSDHFPVWMDLEIDPPEPEPSK